MKSPRTHAQKQRALRGGRAPADRAYDRRRARDPQLSYAAKVRSSSRWKRLRLSKRKLSPLCEDCVERGITRAAQSVDHIQSIESRPDLAFVMSNLRSLCNPCHAQKSAEERKS